MAAVDTLGDVELDATHVTFLGFATAAVALVVANAYGTVTGNSQWLLTDWLISYDAGFVRRGITGTLLWPVARWVDPAVAVASIHVVAYGIVAAAVVRIVLRMRTIPWQVWPILFGPFLLTYPAFNPSGALRKDVLYLATIAAVVASRRQSAAIVGLWVMVPVVLAHEGLVVFAPYLAAAGWGQWTPHQRRHAIIALGAAVVAASVAIVLVNPDAVAATCGAVSGRYPNVACGTGNDAVGMLQLSSSEGLANTSRRLSSLVPSAMQVILLVGLGLGPALHMVWRRLRTPRAVVALVASAWIATIPLAAVASDWGRFLYLHAASVALLTLAKVGDGNIASPLTPRRAAVAASATFLYASTWGIRHGGDLLGPGLL